MAYKVFTNGSPLPASDLNTYLMNQSVMVFANSTARSAALTSPTEGMTTYLEDTNKVEVWTGAAWTDINDNSNAILKSTVTATGDLIVGNGNASVTRLGIGTNGQVLQSNGTTATWVTPSSGAAVTDWTLLTAGTIPTGATTSTVSFTGGYDKYKIHLSFLSGTGAHDLYARFEDSSGNPMSTNEWHYFQLDNNTGTASFSRSTSSEITIQPYSPNANDQTIGWFDLSGCASGVFMVNWGTGSNNSVGLSVFGSGSFNLTNPVARVRFRNGSNNIDGGRVEIYGA